MADNLHTIQKQSFEVDFPSEEKAYEFQERFSALTKNQIAKTIESVFDKAGPKDAILRISKLEIDLGTVDLNNLEKDVIFRLERELLKALESKFSTIKQHPVKGEDELISNQKSLIEVFVFYLQSGTLPWWGRYVREHGVGIEQVFELLLQNDPSNTVMEVVQELRIRSVRNRFIKQFKDNHLLHFLKTIYPSKESLLADSFDLITSIFKSIKSSAFQANRIPIREVFWQYVIETYVIIPPGTSVQIDEKSFNEKLVSFVINHPEVNQRELRSGVFSTTLTSQVKGSTLEKVLKQSLRKVEPARPEKEKVEELVEQDVKEWIGKWYERVSKEQFSTFLQRTLDSDAQFVVQFIENVVRLFKARGLVQSERVLLKALYSFVINYIYIENKGTPGTFSEAGFLSFASEKIADHLKVEPLQAVEILSEEYEEVPEKSRKRTYTQQEIIRFFLLFGALPTYTKIRSLEDLDAIIMRLEPSEMREIISNLDPLILPLIAKRVRYQFEEDTAQKIFEASPELRLAEIVEESFKSPLETTISRLTKEQGRLYEQLKQLMEEGPDLPEEIQKLLADAIDTIEESAVLDFIRIGKIPPSTVGAEPALGLDMQTRSGLIAGIYRLLEEKPDTLTTILKDAVQHEEILTLWIKHLPDDLLLRIARIIEPVRLEERVQWVDLYIAREIKEKKYRVTHTELKQLEWKHILTSSLEEVKQLVSMQDVALKEEYPEELQPGTKPEIAKGKMGEADEDVGEGDLDVEAVDDEQKRQEEKQRREEEKQKQQREKEILEREKQEKLEKRLGREPIYINNAGLVLLHPYLSRLFNMLELLEDKKFKDDASAQKAVHILQYIAYKEDKSQEFELALNKVLCGLEIFEPLDNTYVLEDKEKELCESLVDGVIQNWPTLGKTSADNFRVSFLHREGRLEQAMNGGWQLYVEQKAWDVLMDTLPWPINMVILPWMKKTITVEWR